MKGVDNDTIDVVSPENLSQKIRGVLLKTTNKIARDLDINGYCRIDYRVDQKENIYFLEVNGQVSFHPIGAFVLAGKEQGHEFDDLVHHIIDFAMKNKRRISRAGIRL
ncbi:MAG: ATP-binding protein [Candidatus Electronema sp. VV]